MLQLRPAGSLPAPPPHLVLALLLIAPALVVDLSAEEAVGQLLPPCAAQLTLAEINRESACLEKIIDTGEAAISALIAKFDLTEVQPELTMLTPATQRLTEAVSGSAEVEFQISCAGDKSAIFRAAGMRATASIRYQSFGFTWDGGHSEVSKVRPEMQRISPFIPLTADDPFSFIVKVPLDALLVGIYDISLEMEYDGVLTIPQKPTPGWPERFDLRLYYLPKPQGKSRRQVGKGELKLDVHDVSPVHTAGEPMPVELTLQNTKSPRQRIFVPDHRSFFAAPIWYVILDATTDEILDHGNIIPLEEMLAEPTSVEVAKLRLDEAASVRLVGSILTRLRPGRESHSYSGVIGMTVFRDPGKQGLWQGQTVTADFPFTILSFR